jgi:hypothetical protein
LRFLCSLCAHRGKFQVCRGKIEGDAGQAGVETQNGRFKMIGKLLATLVMLVLAFVAFSADALNGGYFATATGFLFLVLAVVIWFKWGTIGRIFSAAEGNDPIIETASKVVGRLGSQKHDPSPHHSSSSNR